MYFVALFQGLPYFLFFTLHSHGNETQTEETESVFPSSSAAKLKNKNKNGGGLGTRLVYCMILFFTGRTLLFLSLEPMCYWLPLTTHAQMQPIQPDQEISSH